MSYRLAIVAASTVGLLLSFPGTGASLCSTDGAGPEGLGRATARGSAKFLEAASQAFLTFKAIEEASDAFAGHAARTRALLDDAIAEYQAALALAEDLAQADRFLRDRQFDRLEKILGITGGTLNHQRWELIVKTVRESKAPAATLLGVCVAGADSLKSVITRVRPGIHPVQLRRAAYNWHLVLMHGSLVSDAFDASVR